MVANRWDDEEAARWPGEIGQRVYTSRLLGVQQDLVLHGGGNTSVKVRGADMFGEPVDLLVVKGSGADLSEVDESGFATLRLSHVARLATLPELSDTAMAQQMLAAALVPGGPAPSVEAILHAVLPFKFVDHTHADAIVTVANTVHGEDLVRRVFGEDVAIVPYVMPGFLLARAVAQTDVRPSATGMILMNHGIFTWGETAREAYDRMIELVSRAEAYVAERRRPVRRIEPRVTGLPELRAAISAAAGVPMIITTAADADVPVDALQRGPITPDHVIRTKPWPMVGTDVDGYVARYRAYYERHAAGRADLVAIDPAPRVVVHNGVRCAGRTAKDARIASDNYRHTLDVVAAAEDLGGYRPISEADLFDFEYWELEQAKLRRAGPPSPLAGEIALVTGAASGIGRACAGALLGEGAAVVGIDQNPDIKAAFTGDAWLGFEADVTNSEAVRRAIDATVRRFGGLDMLVLNAGIFPPSAAVADLTTDLWRQTMAVNLDANMTILQRAHALLRLAPCGGRVVVIGSKNVPAPGPGAGAYSASKAALTQLARVSALEWGGDGIRVNVIHPNAVFDTGVWSDETVAERAAAYDLTPGGYRTNNVLRTEVTSEDVARLCVAMCGPAFAKTTGAQVPVDGGNDRVI